MYGRLIRIAENTAVEMRARFKSTLRKEDKPIHVEDSMNREVRCTTVFCRHTFC